MITSNVTEQEINEVLNACVEQEEIGESRWPGMTYEQGVKAVVVDGETIKADTWYKLVDGELVEAE